MMAGNEAWGRDYLGKGFTAMAHALDLTLFQAALKAAIRALKTP